MNTQPRTVLDFWRDILAKGYPKGVAIETLVTERKADVVDPDGYTLQQLQGGRT